MREGQALTLECEVKGAETVSWLKDGVVIRNNADFKQTFDGTRAKLEMIEAFLDDYGVYTCLLKNSLGEGRCTCQIIVKGMHRRNKHYQFCLIKCQQYYSHRIQKKNWRTNHIYNMPIHIH